MVTSDCADAIPNALSQSENLVATVVDSQRFNGYPPYATSIEMDQSSPQTLTVEIIEALESCGVDCDQYQLHDYIDVEALGQLVDRSGEAVEVRVTVEGIRLAVTGNGVETINSEGRHSEDQ